MFIVAMVLFLGGMYLFGLAFTITEWQPVVFVLGILLVSAAIAIPTHLLNRR